MFPCHEIKPSDGTISSVVLFSCDCGSRGAVLYGAVRGGGGSPAPVWESEQIRFAYDCGRTYVRRVSPFTYFQSFLTVKMGLIGVCVCVCVRVVTLSKR